MNVIPVFEIGIEDDGLSKAFRQIRDFSGPLKLQSHVIFEGPEEDGQKYITLQLLMENDIIPIKKKKAVVRLQLGSTVMTDIISISRGTRAYSFFFPAPEKGKHKLMLSVLSRGGGFYFHKKGLATVDVSENGMSIR